MIPVRRVLIPVVLLDSSMIDRLVVLTVEDKLENDRTVGSSAAGVPLSKICSNKLIGRGVELRALSARQISIGGCEVTARCGPEG